MAAVSYRFINDRQNFVVIEPKLVYRGIRNFKNILDAGLNLEFYESKLLMSAVYHSTRSFTIGAGITYNNKLSILCQHTTNTSDLQSYYNGEFEIALKYRFK